MLLNTHPTRVVMNDGREAEFQLGRYATGVAAIWDKPDFSAVRKPAGGRESPLSEGNIQHENHDQHCHEDPRRGCLQNSVPRQHLVEDQSGCDATAKE